MKNTIFVLLDININHDHIVNVIYISDLLGMQVLYNYKK